MKAIRTFYNSQDPVLFWSFTATFLLALICLGYIFINIKNLPPQIPLYYSMPWGEKRLSGIPQFLILPALIVVITLINITLSWHLHSTQYVVKRVLSICTVVTALLITITVFQIIAIFI